MTPIHKGSCLCGAVTFELSGEIPAPSACHCSQCRKHSGHFEASTDVLRSNLNISGSDRITWFHTAGKNVRQAFAEAHYPVEAFSVGEDSITAKRPVGFQDLVQNIENGSGVIIHVGWWHWNQKDASWSNRGSHSINAYAVDYDPTRPHMTLKITDPGVDYSGRAQGEMFNTVEIKQIANLSKGGPPTRAILEIVGPDFNRNGRKGLIQNIYVFRPKETDQFKLRKLIGQGQ